MYQYLDLLYDVAVNGRHKDDRTGTGTRSLFGRQLRFDLKKGFPLLTTKRVYWKGVVHELLWFLKGSTNTKYLVDNKVTIWDEWADENGDLGPVYGKQWRAWETKDGRVVDQIADVIEQIKTNPDSRRLIVNAWNVGEIDQMALPPCHMTFQFYVVDGKLSCQLYQRSCDIFLGLPFNIASYSLLTHMVAEVCGLKVDEFVWTGGDVHLYENHIEQAQIQLARIPRALPTLNLHHKDNIDDFDFEDCELVGYNPHSKIPAPIAV